MRESRLRRLAREQGYVLERSRRGKRATDFGLYRLLVHQDHRATTKFEKTLNEVESFLAPMDE